MEWPKPIKNPLNTTQNHQRDKTRWEKYDDESSKAFFFMLHDYDILNIFIRSISSLKFVTGFIKLLSYTLFLEGVALSQLGSILR